MTYYAREGQKLSEHLEKTANLAEKFAGVFGCARIGYTTGVLHDLGKYTLAFQGYLKRSIRGEDVTRGEVIHALQGAKFIEEAIEDSVIVDITGNVIASHHGGLFDHIDDGERTLSVKSSKGEDKLHYAEAVKAFSPRINEVELKSEILNFCKMSQTKKLNPHFMLHLLTKALYSCLVDADRCNSAGLKVDDEIPDWADLISQLENHLTSLPDEGDINEIRKNISEQCNESGGRQKGIYNLSVPTGGGKTLSSLRFALKHADEHKLKRIIYIIPYLSILDQTANKMHEVFSDNSGELIFEHHSNIELPEGDDEEERYHLLASRWDSPIILTTMVQFLETIYSNKASKLRKFHNMSFTFVDKFPGLIYPLFQFLAAFRTFPKLVVILIRGLFNTTAYLFLFHGHYTGVTFRTPRNTHIYLKFKPEFSRQPS